MPHLTIACCFLFILAAAQSSYALADQKGPIILAHRGGAHEFEENTLKAFAACYEKGVRAFETDVRMTKDGVLVVLHDDSLDRTHQASGPVEHKTAAELATIHSKQGQKFLFLEELLDYFSDKPGVLIELEMKTSNKALYPNDVIEGYCQRIYEQTNPKTPEGSKYIFTSFDERTLQAIHKINASAPKGLIVGKPLSSEVIQQAKELNVHHIACQIGGTNRSMVQEAQKQGFTINGWPGHTKNDYYLALGLGVDVHCTDIPTNILELEKALPR